MSTPRASHSRFWLPLACVVALALAPSARPQDEPLYPALDVPETSMFERDAAAAAAHTASVAHAADAEHASAPAAPASATDAASDFDASHFTPSPNPNVRDLDGDGHLDGLWLFQGVSVWLGHGDGRLDPGSFQPTTILSGQNQFVGHWGDVSGDGRLDAVFLYANSVEVFIDQGDGSFATLGPQAMPGGGGFMHDTAVSGNVDGDAFADFVTTTNPTGTQWGFGILYGTGLPGHGWLGAPVTIATTYGPVDAVGLGDLDGNGLIDVLAQGEIDGTNPTLGAWTQGPAGVFTAHPLVQLPFVTAARIDVRDMTGDGLADVVLDTFNSIDLFVGNGSGVLPTTFTVLPGLAHNALFVDVDQDGLVDVLQRTAVAPYGPAVLLARADGTLSLPVSTRHSATPIGTGDFDEDGLLDLWSPEVLLPGRGDGSFAGARNFAIGTQGDDPNELAYADFNEDGTPDLVTVDNGFGIFATLSDVGGSFRPPLGIIPTMASVSVGTGDLDGDGHTDVIAGRAFIGNADLCLGDGSGGFQTFPVQDALALGGQEKTGIGIGQFDLSAPADVVACSPSGLISVRLGQGNLVFGPIRLSNMAAGFGGTPWLFVRDLDGDGLDDLLVLQGSGVYSYRCAGNGLFAPPVALTTFARNLMLADVDGDGDDDLVLADDLPTGDGLVWALLGDGTGQFVDAPYAAIDSAQTPRGVAVADVDVDGLIDLAIGHERSWSLHLGTPGGGWEPQPADVFDLPGAGRALRFIDANIDGRPDLLLAGTEIFSVPQNLIGLTLELQQQGPWHDLGFGLATATSTPFLFPEGSLQASSPFGLVLRDGHPNSAAWFILGLSELSVPFKGGVLVPSPLLLVPAPSLSGAGIASLAATWPPGVPSGTKLWIQGWIADASGPAGFTASNAVVGTTP